MYGFSYSCILRQDKNNFVNRIVLKGFLVLLSCICCTFITSAQPKETVLIGTLIVKGSKTYAYKLQFNDSLGTIKGFSITDVNGPDQTKATITGTINSRRDEIRFSEGRITATNSNWDKKDFCYLDGFLKLQLGNTNIWKGSFTSRTADNKPWLKGDIMVMGSAALVKELNKVAVQSKSDTIIKFVNRLKEAIADTVKPATPKVRRMLPGSTYEIQGNGKTATLEIWDDKIVDGDRVTITHNGKQVLDNYTLAKEHKQLSIHLWGDASDRITITANNQGAQPPNSAMVKLVSGDEEYLINAETEPGKPVHIILKPLKH